MRMPSWNSGTKRGTVAAGMAVLACIALLRAFLGSPDVVAQRSADAFLRKDVGALISLTSPEEANAMNLTRQTVSGYLDATLYKPGDVRDMVLFPSNTGHCDERAYWAYTTYRGQKRRDPLTIFLVQTPRGEWTLNLSYTLYKFYERLHRNESDAEWHRLAAENGLKGMFSVNGIFYTGDPELHRGSVFSP